jgi:hypothetical protein
MSDTSVNGNLYIPVKSNIQKHKYVGFSEISISTRYNVQEVFQTYMDISFVIKTIITLSSIKI